MTALRSMSKPPSGRLALLGNLHRIGVVALIAGVACLGFAARTHISGYFYLDKTEFHMLEPIVVHLEAFNDGDTPIEFEVGGDYRGVLCHDSYQVWVMDTEGTDYSVGCYSFGGLGYEKTIEPQGASFHDCILLNPYARILPPGRYTVKVEKIFENAIKGGSPSVSGVLAFTILPYDAQALIEAISKRQTEECSAQERADEDRERWYDKMEEVFERETNGCFVPPMDESCYVCCWAMEDTVRRLRIQVPCREPDESTPDAEFLAPSAIDAAEELRERMSGVLARIPTTWDDRYYLDAYLRVNRNWVTASNPEDYTVSFTVTNRSNKTLLCDAFNSRVTIDGAKWDGYHASYLARFGSKAPRVLKPGEEFSLPVKFNQYVASPGTHTTRWEIDYLLFDETTVTVK